jgi:uncharacterized membrane protein YcaP (DUF421 family)
VSAIFFNSWWSLGRTAIIGVLAYAALVVILRISGKRTLSKLNAFDFVITVAFGSTLATVLLSRDVSLADGALAFALLTLLQFVVTWSSVRRRRIRTLVTGEPTLVLYQGRLRDDALRRVRVTSDEVNAALRSAGVASLDQVHAVVLETDGSLSVIRGTGRSEPGSTLDGVVGVDEARGAAAHG